MFVVGAGRDSRAPALPPVHPERGAHDEQRDEEPWVGQDHPDDRVPGRQCEQDGGGRMSVGPPTHANSSMQVRTVGMRGSSWVPFALAAHRPILRRQLLGDLALRGFESLSGTVSPLNDL